MGKGEKLPQLQGHNMTCGGGFETWLQYVDGFTLRHFCAFELLNDKRGLACLTDYHRKLVEAAVEHGFGVINEGLHYRASRDWGELIGFSNIDFYKHRGWLHDGEAAVEEPLFQGGAGRNQHSGDRILQELRQGIRNPGNAHDRRRRYRSARRCLQRRPYA